MPIMCSRRDISTGRVYNNVKRYFLALFDLLLPSKCYLCSKFSEAVVCNECLNNLPFRVAIRTDLEHIETAISLLEYKDELKRLLSFLKFEGVKEVGAKLALQIPNLFKELPFDNVHYWIPVPLYKKKLRKRGYNQVEVIFSYFLSLHNRMFSFLIDRKINTAPLFELDKRQRQEIINGAFEIVDMASDLKGKNVVVVDDILTSGTTVMEMAKVLKGAGVKKVNVLTLGYGKSFMSNI